MDVTSCDDDRGEAGAYAAAGIPSRLLIDRRVGTFDVRSEPDPVRFRYQRLYDFGEAVALPHLVSITLDTEELKDYVRRHSSPSPHPASRANATA
ncbi:hypothetical protein ACPCUK_33605 [Streptomyces arboris]|uniref:hypothetical protein n=1 Tax=Streptomyces arboris TaxID=2600619 RepID=UPI003C2AB48A